MTLVRTKGVLDGVTPLVPKLGSAESPNTGGKAREGTG